MSSRGICRCCLSEGRFKSLGVEYRWLSGREIYGHMLMECFGLSVSGGSDRDQQICEVCITRLRDAFNFKKQVLSAEQSFQKLRHLDTEVKSEPDDDVPVLEDFHDDWMCKPDEDNSVPAETPVELKLEEPKKELSEDEIPLCDIPRTEDTSKRKRKKSKSETSASAKAVKKGRRRHGNESAYICILCGHLQDIPHNEEPDVTRDKSHRIEDTHIYCKKCPLSKLIPTVEAKLLECDQQGCTSLFRCLVSLKKHQKKCHKDVYNQPYYCRLCPEWLPSRHHLRRHEETHSPNKEPKVFQCGACDKIVASQQSLLTHQRRTHLLERPFACPHCEYKGYSKVHLNDHMISHTGGKPYTCVLCNKKFARSKSRSLHMRIHNNDRRAVCKVCGQAFVQRASLTYHMTKHHPSEPL